MAVLVNIISQIILKDGACQRDQLSAYNHGLTLWQHEKNYKRRGMLRDITLQPLNPDPCLPMLSEGVANRSDLPTLDTK